MRIFSENALLKIRTYLVSWHRAGGALLLAAVAAGSPLALAPSTALGSDQAYDQEEAATQDSLLVANRTHIKTEPIPDNKGSSLEPIAASSDHRPHMADLKELDSDAEEFGAALAQLAAARAGRSPSDGQPLDLVDIDCGKVEAEPAKFNGVQPGTSKRDDLVAAWGDPDDAVNAGDSEILSYSSGPFRSVEVLLTADMVDAIKIELAAPVAAKDLAKQLQIDKLEAVDVADEQGKLLGQVFPERGVLFMCAEDIQQSPVGENGAQISHVVIQPLDANAFALRAENRLQGPYEKNIRDLRFALTLDPEMAQARWLLAEIYLANGQGNLAESEAAKAMNLEPDNSAYQLRWAQALELLGRYDEAAQETRKVLDRTSTSQVVKAQALHEMARLAAKGDAEISGKAIAFENEAILVADKLATSDNVKERHAAKEVLIDAHLNIAQEIAIRPFNNKMQSISEWISRASGLAEDYIKNDSGSLEWRLRVAQQSLAVLASFRTDKDPAPWVAEAQQSADALMKQCDDQLWQQRIQWEVGVAYFHAAQIEHTRMKTASSLRYGQLSIENLAEGAKSRQATPECERLVGQLYFYIGAIHAIHNLDHEKAVLWYDRAAPLLTAPRPVSELTAPRGDGEELVSMGLSYWQTGQRERALELTKAGTALVEQSVEDKLLERSSLSIPYGNLASMYEQLGDKDEAAKYAELARSVASTNRAQRNSNPNARSHNSHVQPASTAQNRTRPGNTAKLNQPQVRRTTSGSRSAPIATTAGKRHQEAKSAEDLSTASKPNTSSRPSPYDPRTKPSTEPDMR